MIAIELEFQQPLQFNFSKIIVLNNDKIGPMLHRCNVEKSSHIPNYAYMLRKSTHYLIVLEKYQ